MVWAQTLVAAGIGAGHVAEQGNQRAGPLGDNTRQEAKQPTAPAHPFATAAPLPTALLPCRWLLLLHPSSASPAQQQDGGGVVDGCASTAPPAQAFSPAARLCQASAATPGYVSAAAGSQGASWTRPRPRLSARQPHGAVMRFPHHHPGPRQPATACLDAKELNHVKGATKLLLLARYLAVKQVGDRVVELVIAGSNRVERVALLVGRHQMRERMKARMHNTGAAVAERAQAESGGTGSNGSGRRRRRQPRPAGLPASSSLATALADCPVAARIQLVCLQPGYPWC